MLLLSINYTSKLILEHHGKINLYLSYLVLMKNNIIGTFPIAIHLKRNVVQLQRMANYAS